jgi:hypothetical protein
MLRRNHSFAGSQQKAVVRNDAKRFCAEMGKAVHVLRISCPWFSRLAMGCALGTSGREVQACLKVV